MIVHVLMHDPAGRRRHPFNAGHAVGIADHARPEYAPGRRAVFPDHLVTTQPNFRQADWIQPKPGLGGVPLKMATSASKILAPCLCMVAQ